MTILIKKNNNKNQMKKEYQTDQQYEQDRLSDDKHIVNILKMMRIRLICSPMNIMKILQINIQSNLVSYSRISRLASFHAFLIS
jgi:hypothetical protein